MSGHVAFRTDEKWGRKTKERDKMEDLGVGGKVICTCIAKK